MSISAVQLHPEREKTGWVFRNRTSLILLAVLAVLFVVAGLLSAEGFTPNLIGSTLLIAAPLGLMAGGQTLTMLTGGIDLSIAMIATGTAYVVGSQTGKVGPAGALLIGLLFVIVVGGLNGIGVGVFKVNPLIMTLGMGAILLGFLTVGSQSFLSGSTNLPEIVGTVASGSFISLIPKNLWIWALLGGILLIVLKKAGYGRAVYALGDNAGAARLSGVRAWQVIPLVYIASAFLGGVAGLLLASRSGGVAGLQLADQLLLPSVAAAVIGGTSILGGIGGYTGTILGVMCLTVLDKILTLMQVGGSGSQDIKLIMYGLVILILSWIYARVTKKT
jgi:ribose transport system permease protein